MSGHKVEATFYAQVEAKYGRRYDSTLRQQVDGVTGVKVVGILQNRPTKPKGVIVKLTLRFNEEAFLPLRPAATIDIPDSLVQMGQVVDVEAEDENDAAVAEYLAEQVRGVPSG